MYGACASLRFAEGLRRRSEEARAEAAVQEGVALGSLIGIRVSSEDLRVAAMGVQQNDFWDPTMCAALGVWRAAWSMLAELAPLNAKNPRKVAAKPWPARVASWHRDICSFLVAAEHIDAKSVALPRGMSAMRALQTPGSAFERAKMAWRTFTLDPPFEYGSPIIGALCAKQILAEEGIEPTGVAVLGAYAAANPGAFPPRDTQNDHQDQVDSWDWFLRQSVKDGCAKGQEIARFVQAGVVPK